MICRNPSILTFVVALLCFTTTTTAGFSSSASDNVAVYWGQNSYQQSSGEYAQQRLAYYCSNTDVDIIPLAFMNEVSTPTVNFANAGDNCTTFTGSTLLDCPQLEEDIQTCQSTYGKTIMLSIGGATYTEGGFSSSSAAVTAADNVWAMFGPVQESSGVDRPFGDAVVDGFDFDFESSTSNMASFASELRSQMDAATAAGGKTYYLSAAPQCPYPDAADNDMLAGAVSFDFIMVQFYNNYCGLQSYVSGSSTQNNFNFDTWDNWAQTVSKNSDVRILLGIPGSSTAAGSGYESGTTLSAIIAYSKQFSSFGGVMIWDMSQIYANSGFLDEVVADLGSSSTAAVSTTKTSPQTTASPETATTTSQGTTEDTALETTTAAVPTMALGTTTALDTATMATMTPTTTSGSMANSSLETTKTTNAETTKTEATTATSAPTTTSHTTPVVGPYSNSTGCSALDTTHTVTVTVTATVTSTGTQHTTHLTTSAKITVTTSTAAVSQPTKVVQQWGQCGGIGYTGSTQCAAPYSCVYLSEWWAQCE